MQDIDIFLRIEEVGDTLVAVFEYASPYTASDGILEYTFRLDLASLKIRIVNTNKYGIDNSQNKIAERVLIAMIKENG